MSNCRVCRDRSLATRLISDAPEAVHKVPVVLIRINLAAGRVTFVTAAKKEYTGTVDTDLEPGSYKLTPRTERKVWVITPSHPGLRFFVDLENADPWALSYSPGLRLEVTRGSEADRPIGEKLDIEDTLDIQGDPKVNANYVQNAFQGVGYFGWGGPFRLDHKIVRGQGSDSVLIPRAEFNLDTDPLKDVAVAINKVYKTRAGAEAAVKAFGVPGPMPIISAWPDTSTRLSSRIPPRPPFARACARPLS